MEGINEWKLTERVKDSFCHFFQIRITKDDPLESNYGTDVFNKDNVKRKFFQML